MKKNFPLITAHTGCMKTPSNSIDSALTGVDAGADIVEVDVNATKDGVAVLLHDSQVNTPANGTINISDITFEELLALDERAFTGNNSDISRITRLEEVLDFVQQRKVTINLDLKSYTCVKPMAEAVKFRNMIDDVIISGCQKEHAQYVKKIYPEFQVLLNAGKYEISSHPADYEIYAKHLCRDAVAAACCGININYKDCREELLYHAKLRCIPVLVYTVDSMQDMEKFVNLGVHSITTREVETLVTLKSTLKETL